MSDERALAGALLLAQQDIRDRALDAVEDADIQDPACRFTVSTIRRMHTDHVAVDQITWADYVDRHGLLQNNGLRLHPRSWAADITSLEVTPSPWLATEYAAAVAEAARRRRIRASVAKLAEAERAGASLSEMQAIAAEQQSSALTSVRAHQSADDALIPVPSFPVLNPVALHGKTGEIINLIAPTTEAHPAALLACMLSAGGVWLGPGPRQKVANEWHPALIWTLITGGTSSGAKGTAGSVITRLIREVDPAFADERITSGLSTGEGLIEKIRDESGHPEDKDYDRGIDDKRLLIVETEFATVLARMARPGNTLGPVVRDMWDQRPLRTLNRKSSTLTATDHHVAIIAMITEGELLAKLDQSDLDGGTMNRFLPVMSKRTRSLPEGGNLPDDVVGKVAKILLAAQKSAAGPGHYTRTASAMQVWARHYERLAGGLGDTKAGQATARARPQVLRLALVYALLDAHTLIGAEHIEAAIAFWQYVQDSAEYIFGNPELANQHPDRVKLLNFLEAEPRTRAAIVSDCFARNKTAAQIDTLLGPLIRSGLVDQATLESTGGRRPTVFTVRKKRTNE